MPQRTFEPRRCQATPNPKPKNWHRLILWAHQLSTVNLNLVSLNFSRYLHAHTREFTRHFGVCLGPLREFVGGGSCRTAMERRRHPRRNELLSLQILFQLALRVNQEQLESGTVGLVLLDFGASVLDLAVLHLCGPACFRSGFLPGQKPKPSTAESQTLVPHSPKL